MLDRDREFRDRLVEKIDVRQDPADDDRVLRIEAALECLTEGWQLRTELAEREIGEHVRVRGAVDQCGQHRAAGLAEQV